MHNTTNTTISREWKQKMKQGKNLTLNDFLTQEGLAEALGLEVNQLNRLRKEKGILCIKVGTRYFYYEPDVCSWLLKNRPGDSALEEK
jgi:aspartate/tyrosine/aromatic aminotransferase